MNQHWFAIKNIDEFDTPALVVYPDRIEKNIDTAIQMIDDASRLRPHVKTNKMREVCMMMLYKGITKFKCATIAEAEMLGMMEAPDVLLAYQPVGPKAKRLISLINKYSKTHYSCLIDNGETAEELNALCEEKGIGLQVYIDVNVGMNRTGILPGKAFALLQSIKTLQALSVAGLHVYDGHIHDSDFNIRKQKSDAAFKAAETLQKQAFELLNLSLKIIAGGTPTFPVHAQRKNVECSPGTFVFWDWGYKHLLPDQPFDYAALVVSRIVSVIDEETVCLDLGHKSVAAENPLPRVHFLNAPDAVAVSQSEEHLVIKLPDSSRFKVGDVLYGVPVHICPTVALYDEAYVVNNNSINDCWQVIARNRSITI